MTTLQPNVANDQDVGLVRQSSAPPSGIEDTLRIRWVTESFQEALDFVRHHPVRMVVIECAPGPETAQFLRVLATEPRSPMMVLLPGLGVAAEQRVDPLRSLNDGPASWLLLAAARRNLGHVGVKEAQRLVRIEMFREALKAASGNRRAAARTLGVNRRYVLKMLRENPGLEGYIAPEP